MIPMLDGRYRDKYLYPRVQVKILNEQIYIVGIKEGAESVLETTKDLESLNFGNITFNIVDIDIEENINQFQHVDKLLRYKFISPWVALSKTTQNRFKFLKNKDRIAFLNRLLGQNIVFLAREMEIDLNEKVYTKLRLNSLLAKPVDEDSWGAFFGEFQTNFILPNYIGVGNGITRGYGAIHGLYNPEEINLNDENTNSELDKKPETAIHEDVYIINTTDEPKPYRKSNNSKKKKKKTKKVLSEEFDIEEIEVKPKQTKPKRKSPKKNMSDSVSSDTNFNTAQHHKKQHVF